MTIQFISTNESEENEVAVMTKAFDDNEQNVLIEIWDSDGNSQYVTYNKFLEIFDDYGLEGFAFI